MGEISYPPAKAPDLEKPEFTIVTQTPEQLIIRFNAQTNMHVPKYLILLMFIIGILFTLLVPLLLSTADRYVISSTLGLGVFGGMGVLFFFLFRILPIKDSLRIDKTTGRLYFHYTYIFRKTEKITELPFTDIQGIIEGQFSIRGPRMYSLTVYSRDTREFLIHVSKFLEVIQTLHKTIETYLPESYARVV